MNLKERRVKQPHPNVSALTSALKIGQETNVIGFDWKNASEVAPKVEEEWQELKTELNSQNICQERVEEEFGDLLFSMVQVGRHLNIDPEAALQHANQKFVKRFEFMENIIQEKGLILEDLNQSEMDVFWDQVKDREKDR